MEGKDEIGSSLAAQSENCRKVVSLTFPVDSPPFASGCSHPATRMRSFIPNLDDLRRTFRLAAPVALAQVGIMTMGVVDIMMVDTTRAWRWRPWPWVIFIFSGPSSSGGAWSWRSTRSLPRRSARGTISA